MSSFQNGRLQKHLEKNNRKWKIFNLSLIGSKRAIFRLGSSKSSQNEVENAPIMTSKTRSKIESEVSVGWLAAFRDSNRPFIRLLGSNGEGKRGGGKALALTFNQTRLCALQGRRITTCSGVLTPDSSPLATCMLNL